MKNLDIALGLPVIPAQLFTATSHGIGFNLLHAKWGSRIQMRQAVYGEVCVAYLAYTSADYARTLERGYSIQVIPPIREARH